MKPKWLVFEQATFGLGPVKARFQPYSWHLTLESENHETVYYGAEREALVDFLHRLADEKGTTPKVEAA